MLTSFYRNKRRQSPIPAHSPPSSLASRYLTVLEYTILSRVESILKRPWEGASVDVNMHGRRHLKARRLDVNVFLPRRIAFLVAVRFL